MDPRNKGQRAGPAQRGPKLYIVCDHPGEDATWIRSLSQDGMAVILETSTARAVETWYAEVPDLTILDIRENAQERLEVCRNLRNVSVAPMLVILPRQDESEILETYQAGADDCIVGVASPAVFQARILAWARRSWTLPVENVHGIQTPNWDLDPQGHTLIRVDGRLVPLTNLEVRILYLLMSKPGRIFSGNELLRAAQRFPVEDSEKVLRKVMSRLRRKINPSAKNGKPLQTWQGGYAFIDP